ncbi:hypothetical protein JCM11251_004081 [Rhodosporidiobolus azoricus]
MSGDAPPPPSERLPLRRPPFAFNGQGRARVPTESLLGHTGASSKGASLQGLSHRSASLGLRQSLAGVMDGSGTSISTRTRQLGALGIPIGSDSADDEDEQEEPASQNSSGSLQPNPPASPSAPFLDAAATYSRGGSTRSGPSTRAGEVAEGNAFVSEESFRDIVDELTRQNQQLKAKLKRFESARVPNELKKERLFEIRWHEGLPKNRRRDIESFLTDYVQSLSGTGDSSSSSRAFATSDERTTNQDASETTSSLGATLRSRRSSEKEAPEKMRGRLAKSSATGSGSGSGSGTKRNDDKKNADKPSTTAAISPSGPSPGSLDPPALLRRTADIFPSERDVLAAPSFSGAEPRSLTGTGSGMRISDPSARKRKRMRSDSVDAERPQRPAPPRRLMSYEGVAGGGREMTDPDKLEAMIVEMVERLFTESLPVEGSEGGAAQTLLDNPLHSEPQPLPAQSSSNTQYLRALLQSDETRETGGWLYLNLIATFASLHRLNVTVSTVRHALRTRSDLIEVSEEGSKIRWRGPQTKPLAKAEDPPTGAFNMGGMEGNNVEATQMQVDRDEGGGGNEEDGGSSRSTEYGRSLLRPSNGQAGGSGNGTSRNDPSKGSTIVSTAPTSQHPSDRKTGNSLGGTHSGTADGSRSHSSGEQARKMPLHGSSNLRQAVDDLTAPAQLAAESGHNVLGSATPIARPKHLYTPLIFQSSRALTDEENSTTEDGSAASAGDEDDEKGPSKRKKGFEGGVVFFSNDLFFSDLAGDSPRRLLLAEKGKQRADTPHSVLGDSSSSVGATRSGSTRGRSASPAAATETSDLALLPPASSRQSEVDSLRMEVDSAADVASLDGEAGWDGIDDLVVMDGSTPVSKSGDYEIFFALPFTFLQLSGTEDVCAADHFTLQVKLRHPFSRAPSATKDVPLPRPRSPAVPLSPSVQLSSHTIHHHPSVCPRYPRVRMRLSSTTSDSDIDADNGGVVLSGSLSPTSSQVRRSDQFFAGRRGEAFTGGAGGMGDYLMSLALPLNKWAPDSKRVAESDERMSGAADELIYL